ncbi:MAG: UDP-N-acetylmuramate dehydrogenase [Alphaproteobacteria bacterium]|nr:MAG: UDP-N-acetylenolpyruvoylglucosamine reductase [Rickettsiaceae bacterium 4572_127]
MEKPDFISGKWKENVSLSKMTWLKLGGKVDVVFEPSSLEDLQIFLQWHKGEIFVLGGGSNTLIRDGGIDGIVVHLPQELSTLTFSNTTIKVGCGIQSRQIAIACAKQGLSGLEFLYTIPGTIGGGMQTNAGCYGGEISDNLESITILTRDGKVKKLSNKECGFSYRNSKIPKNAIVVEAIFQCERKEPKEIQKQMEETQKKRNLSQPFGQATAGSSFKNPPNDVAGRLIDVVGLKDHKIGGVFVSKKHANFFINDGTGTAKDFEDLLFYVQKTVQEKTGIKLIPEVHFVGKKL